MYDLLTVDAEISYVLNLFFNGREKKKAFYKRGNEIIKNICTVTCKSGVCKCVYSCAMYYKTCIYEVQCCDIACRCVSVHSFNQCCKCTSQSECDPLEVNVQIPDRRKMNVKLQQQQEKCQRLSQQHENKNGSVTSK